jgi:hypothetical protein
MKNIYKLNFRHLILVTGLLLASSMNVHATVYTLDLALSGQNEVPPNAGNATGILMGSYDDATNVLSITMMFNGLSATAIAAHFHGPASPGTNGPVQIPLTGFPTGVTSGTYSNSFTLTPEQESQLLCGLWYVNIHTTTFPGGEIRSQLKEWLVSGNISTFELALTGLKEVPPNATPATGTLFGTYDASTNTLSFVLKFNGLVAPATASHFHGPAAPGVNAPVQIPLTGFPAATSGNYSNSFVLTDLQESQLLAGLWYINIHSSVFPGGEIRAQVAEGTLTGECSPPSVPVANWALLIGIGLIGTFTLIRFSRSRNVMS